LRYITGLFRFITGMLRSEMAMLRSANGMSRSGIGILYPIIKKEIVNLSEFCFCWVSSMNKYE
jgi:hypothetical protein